VSANPARSRAAAVTAALLFAGCATALPALPAGAARAPSCPPPWLGSTTAVSPTVSADGRFVAFDAMAPEYDDGGVSAVFLRDILARDGIPTHLIGTDPKRQAKSGSPIG